MITAFEIDVLLPFHVIVNEGINSGAGVDGRNGTTVALAEQIDDLILRGEPQFLAQLCLQIGQTQVMR
nr:hypothetical protein [Microvirga splendida]